MNLNNKYLAVGLSAAAVVVVGYQIFINKACETRPSVRREAARPAASRPTPRTTPPADTAAVQSQPTSGDNGLVIDFNSPMLLKRIHARMAEQYPRQELPPQFGPAIFTRGKEYQPDQSTGNPVTEKEMKFELNAIILDMQRRLAIINNTIVKEGDMVGGAKIFAIAKSKVVLKINGQTVILSTNSRIKTVRLLGGTGENNQ
jgi:hypothetical protein